MSQELDPYWTSVQRDISLGQPFNGQVELQPNRLNNQGVAFNREQTTVNHPRALPGQHPITPYILEGLLNFSVLGMFNVSEFSEHAIAEQDTEQEEEYPAFGYMAFFGGVVLAVSALPVLIGLSGPS